MKFTVALAAGILAFADSALAHYRFTSLIFNGKTTGEYEYVRQNTNMNSPVTDVTSNDIRCNVGGLASGSSTKVATVAAGAKVGFALDTPIFHPGPLNVYMSKATGDVKTYDGSGDWFKISELGAKITSSEITFAADDLDQYTFDIPAATPAGQYLLRIEHIALHGASEEGGAQFYISCAQLDVTSSGSGDPEPTVKLPGAYSATDANIELSIYWPIPTSYTNPGPAVWSE